MSKAALPFADVLALTPSGVDVVDRWLDAMEEARKGDGDGRVSLDPDDYE